MKVKNRRFPDFLNLISTQIYSLKTVFSTFLPKKKVLVASHFSQPKYRRFGPKRASYIWIIGDLLSPCDKYRNEKNGLYLSQDRGAAEVLWQNIDHFLSSYICTRDETKLL